MESLEPRLMLAAAFLDNRPAANSFASSATSAVYDYDDDIVWPPDTPKQLVSQAVSGSSVYISWKKANNANGYLLWCAGPDGQWQLIAILRGQGTTHFLDTNLTPGAMYSYRVQAYNDAGNSKSLSE